MQGSITKTIRVVALASAVAASLVLAACGSPTATAPGTTGGGAAPAAVAGVPTLDELYRGTGGEPPTTAPKPTAGKSVWWISCGQSIPSCAAVSAGAGAAAEAMGWRFNVADGNTNIGGAWANSIRTAIAAKPDAIAVYGIDCPGIKQPLQDAVAQGIKIMGVQSLDCSQSGDTATLFDVPMSYSADAPDTEAFWKQFGKTAADALIARTGGNAKIINSPGDLVLNKLLDQGFKEELAARCPGCQIVADVPFAQSGLVPGGTWIQAFRSALVSHPDATAAFAPWDFMWASLGGAQAVKESGLEIATFGGEGTTDTLDLIRRDQHTLNTNAFSQRWMGWAAMDNLNRAFHGQPAVPQGLGFAAVDATHNLPPAGQDYEPATDYQAAYRKAWSGTS